MSELWSVVGFEVRKFSEEPGDLSDDSKEIVRGGVIVHLKPFNGFIVLDNWIERAFF